MNRLLKIMLVVLPMALLSLALIDVQVGSPSGFLVTPTVDLIEELPETHIESDIRRFQVITAYEPDDEQHQVLTVAYPHVVFATEEIAINLYPDVLPTEVYMLIGEEHGLLARTFWHAQWLEQSSGNMELNLWFDVKPPDADEYETWVWEDVWGYEEGATFSQDWLDATLFVEDSGTFEMRINAELIAFNDDDGLSNTKSLSHDMTIYAFSNSFNRSEDTSDLQPAFGRLEYDGILLNWQAWNFGPCNLSVADSEITLLLDQACTAITDEEFVDAIVTLEEILTHVPSGDVDARIRTQLGILKVLVGNVEVATRYFQTALTYWQSNDNALMTATTMHNLGIVYHLSNRTSDAQWLLIQSATLNDHLDNSVAAWLSWLQLAVIWEDWDSIAEAIVEFRYMELSQAEAFEYLINQQE